MERAVSDYLADGERFALIEAARSEATGSTRRRLDLLRAAFLANQVPAELRTRIIELEAAVEMVFSTHRGVVAGRRVNNNEILDILRESDDGDEATRGVGGLEDGRRGRCRRRSRACATPECAARRRRLSRLVRALAGALGDGRGEALRHARRGRRGDGRAVRALEARARRGACGPVSAARRPSSLPGTTPTRSSRRSRSRAESISGRCSPTVTRWRSPSEPSPGSASKHVPVLDRSDLFPRDDKCQHAFCIDIDREGDVRVLANVVPGQYWLDTMLHELGHATFDGGIDPTLPWMLRDCHTRRHRGDRDPDGAARRRCRVARACARS